MPKNTRTKNSKIAKNSKTQTKPKKSTQKKSATKTKKQVLDTPTIPTPTARDWKEKYPPRELIPYDAWNAECLFGSPLGQNASGGGRIRYLYWSEVTKRYVLPMIKSPLQEGYILAYKWKQNTKPQGVREDQVTSFVNIDGAVAKFPINSNETVDDPTDEEKRFEEILTSIQEKMYEFILREMWDQKNIDDGIVSQSDWSEDRKSRKKLDKLRLIRPIIRPGMRVVDQEAKVLKFVEDPSKSGKVVPKINAFRKSVKDANGKFSDKKLEEGEFSLDVKTKILGPGNKELSIRNVVGKRIRACILYCPKNIYIGGHGTLPFKASTQADVPQMTATPVNYEEMPVYLNNDDGAASLSESSEGDKADMQKYMSDPKDLMDGIESEESFDLDESD